MDEVDFLVLGAKRMEASSCGLVEPVMFELNMPVQKPETGQYNALTK